MRWVVGGWRSNNGREQGHVVSSAAPVSGVDVRRKKKRNNSPDWKNRAMSLGRLLCLEVSNPEVYSRGRTEECDL